MINSLLSAITMMIREKKEKIWEISHLAKVDIFPCIYRTCEKILQKTQTAMIAVMCRAVS